MSTITQRIPNFLLGISQQPDNRKFPGQLKDCVNAFPDYALGLLKRPGGQFTANLEGATTSGKWFSILRDPQEKYVAQYDNNTFKVWGLIETSLGLEGSPRAVDMGSNAGVPGTCFLNDTLSITNAGTGLTDGTFEDLATATTGSGTGLTVDLEIASGVVTTVTINQYGSGYADGDTITMDDTVTYPSVEFSYEYQLKTKLSIYNTAVDDTADKLALLHAAQATYKEVLDGQNSTEQQLFETNYNYPVSSVEQYLVSGILKKENGVYVTKNNNTVVQASASLPANYALGVEVTDEHPLIAAQGNRVYKAILTVAAAYTAGDLATALAAMNTAQTNYDNAVTAENTARANYQAEVADCVITSIPSTGYLYGATADDIEVLTLNDYTFVLNKAKTVAMTSNTTSAKPYEAFVVLQVVGTGHYRIKLDGTQRATYNAGTGGDVDDILDDLVSDIDGNTYNGTTFSATRVGPGIYISADAAFTIEVVGGPSDTAMTAFQDTVPNVSDLPLQCHNGYKVRVVNSLDVDVDDMYVEFITDGGSTYGTGTWEESNAWDITYELDPQTLPHQLVRQADGSFTFGPITWEDRLIGDLTTNPNPSFVGTTIKNVFFYRNRLGFLANESVILSRAGDYFNFFATTALAVTDDDPIDISASSVKPVNLRFVRPASVGLVLFSDTEQFILSTDSDILSPKTSKINELSSYECDNAVEPVTLGTSLAFLSKTPLYSRLYEITRISTTEPPVMGEQTQYVPELVPATINSMIASPALSLVSLGTTGSSTVYQYRFIQQGDQRTVNTWYKWNLTGTLLDQFFDISTYYAVVANGTDVYVQSYDLTQASEEGFLTLPSGEKTDVCLDLWNVNPYRTYDDATDTTRIRLPYGEVTGGTFSVVLLGRYIGASDALTSASVGAVLYPTVESDVDGNYVDIEGDYRGRDLIIGYIYNMEVTLPKFFVTSTQGQTSISDFTSDLIIHRIKVSTGLSGPVKYQVDITGRPEWSNTIEAVTPYVYDLSNVNLSADATHNVPVYQRNENLSLKIVGDTPMPVTLLSLTWEGNYKTGFYQRSS